MANTPTITVPIKSVFDPDEEITLPEPTSKPITREELTERFARLLGRSELPVSEWRAVGDFEALDETVRAATQWLTEAMLYRRKVTALPAIPHRMVTLEGTKQQVRVPAPGTRAAFDTCMAGVHGGLSPSQVQTAWNTAKRQVLRQTRGIGGLRGGQR